ncbi:MAG: hypothetical protein IJU23_14705 [Proteobacteria bacterium]|nr:hypothetical protein [Pseudomonadota bacterium]
MNDILSTLDDKTRNAVMKRWRQLVSREIKRFVKERIKSSEFRNIKPTGMYFGIRNLKKSGDIQMFGTKPNAGFLVGFGAPVNRRVTASGVYHFRDEHGWHSTHKKQLYSDSLGSGIDSADVPYFGTSARPKGNYFGIKRKRRIYAYGLVRGYEKALPVYADEAIPDWIMDDYGNDVDSIVRICGELAIEQVIGNL